jgi:hypothetical protein
MKHANTAALAVALPLSLAAGLAALLAGCLNDYQDQYKLGRNGRFQPAYTEATLTECANKEDDDGDGLIDCGDPDCGVFGMCADTATPKPVSGENTAELCRDKADNDANGLIDCADANGCGSFQFCQPPVENNPALCLDQADNDLDGFIDCKDSDCKGFTVCSPTENTLPLCKDGKDNDGDLLVDCRDPDCKDLYVCSYPTQDTVLALGYKTKGKISPLINAALPPYNLTWYYNGGDAAGADALGLKGIVPGHSEETSQCGQEPLCRKITFTDAWGIAFTLFFRNDGAQDTVDLGPWIGSSLRFSVKTAVGNLRIKIESKHMADAVEIPLSEIGFDPLKPGWQEVSIPLIQWMTMQKMSANRLPFSIWKPGGPGGEVFLENIRIE